MRKVYSYKISPIKGVADVGMPEHAQVLSVAPAHDGLRLWAIVNPEAPDATRRFSVVATGEELTSLGLYVGSVPTRPVLHVFDEGYVDMPKPLEPKPTSTEN